jgi:FdhD protein
MQTETQPAEILPDRATAPVTITRFSGSQPQPLSDLLAVEEPLELQLTFGPADARTTRSISVTMRTPGHDFELVAGFLLTEGIVLDSADILAISYLRGQSAPARSSGQVLAYQPERNVVLVELLPGIEVSMANLERNFYTTSSCGICGKASLLALRTVCPPRALNQLQVHIETLYSLPGKLRQAQSVFDRTGGLHASGLFSPAGELLSLREDVGRHNAVDKLLGAEFLADRTPAHNRILLLSGRASFELLQKALMAGIQMVVSVGAPSSLAVQVASEFDITLLGFLRDDHCNVYHGAERILTASQRPAQ